jgi:hypothetical protein
MSLLEEERRNDTTPQWYAAIGTYEMALVYAEKTEHNVNYAAWELPGGVNVRIGSRSD